MITVLVANPKGGCGKTTIATHLAAAFAGAGLRAALADADRQVLPSGFDEPVTAEFLKQLETLKPIRKSKTAVGVLRNRVQTGTRMAAKLDKFMLGVGHTGVGRLRHRMVYADLAGRGLSVFDLGGKQNEDLQTDWAPVLRYIENSDPAMQVRAAGE